MVAIFTGLGAGFERGSGAALGAAGILGNASYGRAGEGVSINAATGNLILTQQDQFLVGLGPDASVSRTYNSAGVLNVADDADGADDNWRFSSNRKLFGFSGTGYGDENSQISRLSADGSVITYIWDAEVDAYVTTDGAGVHDQITQNASGEWIWRDGTSRIEEIYDHPLTDSWLISALRDSDGNALTYAYDANDRVTSIKTSDADGSQGELQYGWTVSGQIEEIRTFNASGAEVDRTAYSYSSGRLQTVTVDLNPGNASDSEIYEITYAYNSAGLVESISQTDGSRVEFDYHGDGRIWKAVQTVAATDIRETSFTYQSGQTTIIDAHGQQTVLYYDDENRLTRIDAPSQPNSALYTYDADGNVGTVTNAAGEVTRYAYDAAGNVTRIIDPNQDIIERKYDDRNNLILETVYGSHETATNDALTTRYVYDDENHLRFVISPEGRVTEHVYDAHGRLTHTIEHTDKVDVLEVAKGLQPISVEETNGGSDAPISFTVEAETMAAVNFIEETRNIASKNKVVSLFNDTSPHADGTLSYIFDQVQGEYDITVTAHDENDGAGSIELRVNGVLLETFNLDQNTSVGGTVVNENRVAFTHTAIALTAGDVIELTGYSDGGEWVRIDKLDFAPVSASPAPAVAPTPTHTSFTREAELLELSGYVSEARDIASGDALASLYDGNSVGTSPTSGTITYVFDEAAGEYHLSLIVHDENDGAGNIEVRLNGVLIHTFTLDQNTTIPSSVTDSNRYTLTIPDGIDFATGDILEITGNADGSEWARVDKLEFTSTAATTPAPAPDDFSYEAENMIRDGVYIEETSGVASGGKLMKLPYNEDLTETEGTLSYTFDRAEGAYDIVLRAFDENDGNGKIEVYLNEILLDTLNLNQTAASATSGSTAHPVDLTIDNITLAAGDVIKLVGYSDGGEWGRVDKIDFIGLAGTGELQPTPEPGSLPPILAVDLLEGQSDYVSGTINTSDEAPPVAVATLFHSDPTSTLTVEQQVAASPTTGTLSHVFEGESGDYEFDITVYDENDGAGRLEVYIDDRTIPEHVFELNNTLSTQDHYLGPHPDKPILSLQQGQTIHIKGYAHVHVVNGQTKAEWARWESFQLTPVGDVTTEPTPEPTPSTAPSDFTVEAESLVNNEGSSGYIAATSSSTNVAGLYNGDENASPLSGTLVYTFDQTDGVYDLDIVAYDEHDGESTIEVRLNGVQIDSYVLNEVTTGNQFRTHTLASIALQQGDVLTIEGNAGVTYDGSGNIDKAEWARIDKLTFTSAQATPSPTPTPTATPGTIEAEDMTLNGFYVEDRSVASKGEVISLLDPNVDWQQQLGVDGTATTTFSGESGQYRLDITAHDENDGASTFEIRVNGATVQTFTMDQNSSVSGSVSDQNRVVFTIDNLSIISGDTISIFATQDGGEWARIDKLEFTPVSTAAVNDSTNTTNSTSSALTVAFLGQSNAERHFRENNHQGYNEDGKKAFEATIEELLGFTPNLIQAATGNTRSNQTSNLDDAGYWWALDTSQPNNGSPNLGDLSPYLNAINEIDSVIGDSGLDAIIWAQGENDAKSILANGTNVDEIVSALKISTKGIFKSLWERYGDVPIFIQQIGYFPDGEDTLPAGGGSAPYADYEGAFDAIRQAQLELVAEMDNVFFGYQPTSDLDVQLDSHNVHFTADGYKDIAANLALRVAETVTAQTVLSLEKLELWRAGLGDVDGDTEFSDLAEGAQVTEYIYNPDGTVQNVVTYSAASQADDGYGAGDDASVVTQTHDYAGRVLTRTVSGQNQEAFTYDGLGRLTSSTDLRGGTTNIVFNDAAMMTTVTAANGAVTISTFNRAGELVSMVGDNGTVANAQDANIEYVYDDAGQLRLTTRTTDTGVTDKTYHLYDELGRKTADISAAGEVYETKYDALGRVVATVRYQNRLDASTLTNLASNLNVNLDIDTYRPDPNAKDLWQWSVHDDAGRIVQSIQGDGAVTDFTFDAAGRLVKTKSYANTIGVSGLKSTGYASLQTPVADPDKDVVLRRFYDADGLLIGTLNGEGYLSENIYDGMGRLVSQRAYSLAVPSPSEIQLETATFQQLVQWTNSANAYDSSKDIVTRNVYDGQGHLRYSVDPLGSVTEFIYGTGADAIGLVRSTISYANRIDPSALSAFTMSTVSAEITASSDDRQNWTIYNLQGEATHTIDAEGAVVAFIYDNQGRVLSETRYSTLLDVSNWGDNAQIEAYQPAPHVDDRETNFVYNIKGELIYTVDGEGYVVENIYDAAGRLIETIQHSESIAHGTYDPATIASAVTSAQNATTSAYEITTKFDYDHADRIIQTYENYVDAQTYERRTLNEYDGNGTLLKSTLYNGADVSEATTEFIYDETGRKISEILAPGTSVEVSTEYSYDGLGNLVSMIDANDVVTSYEYDKNGQNVTTTVDPTGENIVTRYAYDAFGQNVLITDARQNTTYNYYDLKGQMVFMRDAEGYVTQMQYNAFGDMISSTRYANIATNPASVDDIPEVTVNPVEDATTAFGYDRLGRRTHTTNAEHEETSQKGQTFSLLNAFGQVEWFQNEVGDWMRYIYDQRGLLAEQTILMGEHSSLDPSSSTLHSELESAYNSDLANDELIITQYGYDGRGNRISITEALGRAEERSTYFEFDALDRISAEIVSPDGGTTVYRTDFKLDARGNQIEVRAANHGRTWRWYDSLGRLTDQVDASGAHSRFEYDDNGNLKRSYTYREFSEYADDIAGEAERPSLAPETTGEIAETLFDYDKLNRLISTTDAENGKTYQVYDAVGNIVWSRNKLGGWTEFLYDSRGLVLEERLTDAETSVDLANLDLASSNDKAALISALEALEISVVNTFTYDAAGRQTIKVEASETEFERETHFEYDRMGRLTLTKTLDIDVTSNALDDAEFTDVKSQIEYDALGRAVWTSDTGGNRTHYWYDALGRVTFQISPSGTVTHNDYDGLGNVVRTKVYAQKEDAVNFDPAIFDDTGSARETHFEYDNLGQLKRSWVTGKNVVIVSDAQSSGDPESFSLLQNKDLVTEYVYDALGNVTQLIDPNGGITKNYYDDLSRKTHTVDAENHVTQWVYDAEGNVVREHRFVKSWSGTGAPPDFSIGNDTTPEDRVTVYTYDKMGRKKTETRLKVETLNDVGVTLRTSLKDVTIVYEYNDLGLVTSKTYATGEAKTFEFDNRGRLISESSNSFTNENADSVAPRTTYEYDARDQLAATYQHDALVVGGTGDHESRLAALNAANDDAAQTSKVIKTSYVYDKLGRQIEVVDAEDNSRFYHYDEAGRLVREEYERTSIDMDGTTHVQFEGIGYDYDAEGRIIRQGIVSKGEEGAPAASWTYAYADSDMHTVYNAYGQVVSMGYDNNASNNTIASINDDITVIQSFEYDDAGRLVKSNSGDGVWKHFLYDANGNQIVAFTSAGADLGAMSINDILESWDILEGWNNFDDILSLGSNNAGVVATINIYDKRNMVVSSRQPDRELADAEWAAQNSAVAVDDIVVSYRYNAFGELEYQQDARGTKTEFDYNNMGRLVETRILDVEVLKSTWENGAEVVTLDANGAPETELIDHTTRQFYDEAGRLEATQDANSVYRETQDSDYGANKGYITRQDLVKGTGYDGNQVLISKVITPDGNAVTTHFDYAGNAIKKIDQRGRITEQVFDELGRVTKVIHADGLVNLNAYDEIGHTVQQQRSHTDLIEQQGSEPEPSETVLAIDAYFEEAQRLNYGELTGQEVDNIRSSYSAFPDDAIARQMDRERELRRRAYEDNSIIKKYGGFISRSGELKSSITKFDSAGRVVSEVSYSGEKTHYDYSWGEQSVNTDSFTGWLTTTTFETASESNQSDRQTTEFKDIYNRTRYKVDLGGLLTEFRYDSAGRLTWQGTDDTNFFDDISFEYFNTNRTREKIEGKVRDVAAEEALIDTYNPAVLLSEHMATFFNYDVVGNIVGERSSTISSTAVDNQGQLRDRDEDNDGPDGKIDSIEVVTIGLKDAHASYDALGRLSEWIENGGDGAPAASVKLTYDANSNIRRSLATHIELEDDGTYEASEITQDYWFSFDLFNRVVVSEGVISNTGKIDRGTYGFNLSYDEVGNRKHLEYYTPVSVYEPTEPDYYDAMEGYYYDPGGTAETEYVTRRETYSYDSANRLTSVHALTQQLDGSNQHIPLADPDDEDYDAGTLIGELSYDALGRQIEQKDFKQANENETTLAYHKQTWFDDVSDRISADMSVTRTGSDTQTSKSQFHYTVFSGDSTETGWTNSSTKAAKSGEFLLGNVGWIRTVSDSTQNNQSTTSFTYNHYEWADGVSQKGITHQPGSNTDINKTTYTYKTYGGERRLIEARINTYDADAYRNRTIRFQNDANGQLISRHESDAEFYTSGNPHEYWYRFGGKEMGYISNNGALDYDYFYSVESRSRSTKNAFGAFRDGRNYGEFHASFAAGVEKINSYSQGSTASGYTTRAGDTFSSIAANLYGDAALWYKIAQANGASADLPLAEGMKLTLPAGVMRNTHNASTFKPYNPAEAIGDVSPSSPAKPPPAKKGCGVIGQAIMAVVAVVVTAAVTWVTGGAGTAGVASFFHGAIAGAAGSVASQGVGLAIGAIDEFSWSGVATAALAGGIGGSLGDFGGDSWIGAGIRGATGSALTQGIAVAAGWQEQFSWSGVAAAGVAGAIGHGLSKNTKWGRQVEGLKSAENSFGNSVRIGAFTATKGMASAMVNAKLRSVLDGGSFERNLQAAIPDIIGQAVGGAVANAVPKRNIGAEIESDVLEKIANDANLEGAAREQFIKAHRGRISKYLPAVREDNEEAFELVLDEVLNIYAEAYGSENDVAEARALLSSPEQVASSPRGESQATGERLQTHIVSGKSVARARAALGFRVADKLAIKTGNLAINVGNEINSAIESVPGADIALKTIDAGLMIAGGPTRFALSQVGNQVDERVLDLVEGQFQIADYSDANVTSGSVGTTVLADIALNGVGAFKSAAATSLVLLNRRKGIDFQNDAHAGIFGETGVPQNHQTVPSITNNGKPYNTIPDVLSGKLPGQLAVGVVEYKNPWLRKKVGNSPQIQSQLNYAAENGMPYSLVISPKVRVAEKLRNDIIDHNDMFGARGHGGGIYVYDPKSDVFEIYDGG